jgi:hypothetical protein
MAFQVLTAVNMKMAVFWAVGRVVWQIRTDVSEVLSTSVIRMMIPS